MGIARKDTFSDFAKEQKTMKLLSAIVSTVLSQACGPTADMGGAFWPGQSPEDPCGIHFTDTTVAAGQKCTLTITDPAAVPYFITLGGVFVTSQMMPGDMQYFFHTYDNWAGNYAGVDVTIFWQNPDAGYLPDGTYGVTGCANADQVCITCLDEVDTDADGYPGPVPGVYLGNFMHDFRHAEYSCVNVPIANSAGHIAGTTYTVQLFDDTGSPVAVNNVASHYGHAISPSTDAATGSFTIHVGCEDFNGQFLYFSFCHATATESSGWYSTVTAADEGTASCPVVSTGTSTGGTSTGGSYGGTTTGGGATSSYSGAVAGTTKGQKNKNKQNKNKNRNYEYDDNYANNNYDQNYGYDSYNGTDYAPYDNSQYGNYGNYNYRK